MQMPENIEKLTLREREVFELIIQKKTTNEIARMLFLSKSTVKNYKSNILKKLNARSMTEAVIMFYEDKIRGLMGARKN